MMITISNYLFHPLFKSESFLILLKGLPFLILKTKMKESWWCNSIQIISLSINISGFFKVIIHQQALKMINRQHQIRLTLMYWMQMICSHLNLIPRLITHEVVAKIIITKQEVCIFVKVAMVESVVVKTVGYTEAVMDAVVVVAVVERKHLTIKVKHT